MKAVENSSRELYFPWPDRQLPTQHYLTSSWPKKLGFLFYILPLLLVLLLTAVIGSAVYYHSHIFPGVKIGGYSVGNLSPAQARTLLAQQVDKPVLQLTIDNTPVLLRYTDLGMNVSIETNVQAALQQGRGHFLPLVGLFDQISLPLLYESNPAKAQETANRIIQEHTILPRNAELEYEEETYRLNPDTTGKTVERSALLQAMSIPPAVYSPPLQRSLLSTSLPAQRTLATLSPLAQAAQERIDHPPRLTYATSTYQPSKPTVASWLTFADSATEPALSLEANSSKIAEYVTSLAKIIDQPARNATVTTLDGTPISTQAGQTGRVVNQAQLVQTLSQMIQQGTLTAEVPIPVDSVAYQTTYRKQQTPVATPQPTPPSSSAIPASSKQFRYCIQLNGVEESYRADFATTATQVYASNQGWSLGGAVTFVPVETGCNFVLWLSAANLIPSFSSGCDATYSCRVGRNVIINFDRWRFAASSWGGDNLYGYRTMVLNHETGHWLGFDHSSCPAAGQLAPLMQQQSISLQGCRPNPWPTPAELSSLAQRLGIK